MFVIAYVYAVVLACVFVYKTLSNDPERDKIWGKNAFRNPLKLNDKKITLLKTRLDHFQNLHIHLQDDPNNNLIAK